MSADINNCQGQYICIASYKLLLPAVVHNSDGFDSVRDSPLSDQLDIQGLLLQVTTCRVVGSRKVAIPKMDDSVEKLEECGKNHVLKLADITDYAKKQDPPISLPRGLIRHVTCGETLVMQPAMTVNSSELFVSPQSLRHRSMHLVSCLHDRTAATWPPVTVTVVPH